ncbi:hypothetical protein OIN60_20415 [Paenibacillus sp. P96]|uniref:Uncharacterized protein n=1 Tax=Paenibacillus zeirhizosphaerae TaxID=2987519 RepID=A0ABT9FWI1_9BACL|nr:hypothetical protein [Paenibacillus sp. P96]MDP4099093.1 hypothetical protein [Paenibacillus sp. P96]
MSQANIPNITSTIDITREEAITLIIASIAMEELGLSHILNAEGEKLQYVLGTLPGVSLAVPPTIGDLLAVNDSIRKTLKETVKKDWVLSNKLDMVLCDAKKPVAPIGPTCVPFMRSVTVPVCGPTELPVPVITCVPINYNGPIPCVPLQLPSGATCVPVPPADCVLLEQPSGVTCISRTVAEEVLLTVPRC